MIQKLLRIKHWQLFLLVFGIPFFTQIILMILIIVGMGNFREPNFPLLIGAGIVFFLMMTFVMVVHIGWFWAIGVGLQSKIQAHVPPLKVKRFKIFFFIPFIYIFLILIFALIMSLVMSENPGPPSPAFLVIIPIIVLMHLFSIFCMFHTLYFCAKTIKTTELQRQVSFSDFIGEFFLLWFHFVGVWILQPRINRIAELGDEDIYRV